MKLNDPLVDSFEFDGKEYQINLSFDNVLDVFDVMNDQKLFMGRRVELALLLLVGEEVTENALPLWEYIKLTFISPESEESIEYDLAGKPLPVMPQEQFTDLVKDAEYIYSSFVQAYGISLFDVQGELSWVEFKALLNTLPEETVMQRIVKIRQWDGKGSPEEKAQMRKLQKQYSLREEDDDE